MAEVTNRQIEAYTDKAKAENLLWIQ